MDMDILDSVEFFLGGRKFYYNYFRLPQGIPLCVYKSSFKPLPYETLIKTLRTLDSSIGGLNNRNRVSGYIILQLE